MYHERQTKARKQFRCDGCFGKFAPGSVRWNLAGVSDGDFWSVKLCEGCKAAHVEWSANAEPGDGWEPGTLRDLRDNDQGACSTWGMRSIYRRGTPICGNCGRTLPVPALRWRDGTIDYRRCCHRPEPITLRELWKRYSEARRERDAAQHVVDSLCPTKAL